MKRPVPTGRRPVRFRRITVPLRDDDAEAIAEGSLDAELGYVATEQLNLDPDRIVSVTWVQRTDKWATVEAVVTVWEPA